jgi:hypothetical protein
VSQAKKTNGGMTANAGIPHLKHRDLKSCCAAVFLRLLNRRFTVNNNHTPADGRFQVV